jgi:site-specific recombinase XerD
VGLATIRAADQYVTARVKARSLMKSSAREVRGVLRRFAAVVPEVDQITRRRVRRWLEGLDVAAGTARSYFTAVRQFCRWLVLEGHLAKDPTLGIAPPKKPDYAPRALEPWEVTAVLRSCKNQRERLMVILMAQEAFRCCEVARLSLADIDLRHGLVTVQGKGDKQRTVALVEQADRELRRYLAETDICHGPLFPSRWEPTKAISANWVSELVGDAFRRSGIKARARDGKSPHALRHTALSDMVDNGADVLEVQETAGHADLSTTKVYLRRRRADQLRTAMEGRHYGSDERPARRGAGAA